jgi:Thermostable hemolysin
VSFVEYQAAPWAPEPFVYTAVPAAAPYGRLQLHRRGDEHRAAVEGFVAEVYRRHFAARLQHFMPVLVSLGGDGATNAAAGYRGAVEPLFLECYLQEPIEQVLARAAGKAVAREHIVEVGQFAARRAGEGRRLMRALARHLVDSGFRWAVITATADLRRLFGHLRLCALPLATAQRHCIGNEARLWGSYYRHAPKVLAGDLVVNLDRLEHGRR